MDRNLKLTGGKIYTNGALHDGDVVVCDGKIAEIRTAGGTESTFCGHTLDCAGLLVLPGTIDTHVHIREPGSEHRETFTEGTQAAAAGGVTTLFEHPISVPPPSTRELLENRIRIAAPQIAVDVCFFGALGEDCIERAEELKACGAVAFKSFLQEAMPGREKEFAGMVVTNDYDLLRLLKETARLDVPAAFHAENNDIIVGTIAAFQKRGYVTPQAHYDSRPVISETECVSKLLLFSQETGARIVVCHISSPQAMELVRRAKRNGVRVVAETCPHYLFTCQEEAVALGPMGRCNPPIRPRADVEKLWEYVADGTVDIIGSDHGPYTLEEKLKGTDNIFLAPAGLAGLEVRVPLMLDAVNRGKLSLERFVQTMCENPATLFGIGHRKGFIREGFDGDFVIVDMDRSVTLRKESMYSKGRQIADMFDGRETQGAIRYTIVRGRVVAADGVVDRSLAGSGEIVKARPC